MRSIKQAPKKNLFTRGELRNFIRGCRKGNKKLLEKMLKRVIDPNVLPEHIGSRPLSAETRGGDVGVVKLLLDAGANPNLRDSGLSMPPNGYPLESACKMGYLNIAQLLVSHGADINQKGYF